tara:strand:+ start:2037 stop:2279 length:243 start_codon:yes stop_codon:yes gene_type:complete
MSTLTCKGYIDFKEHAHEFLARLPDSSVDEADNGFKCLGLLYLGMETTRQNEIAAAAGLLEMCGEKVFRHELGLPIWDLN